MEPHLQERVGDLTLETWKQKENLSIDAIQS